MSEISKILKFAVFHHITKINEHNRYTVIDIQCVYNTIYSLLNKKNLLYDNIKIIWQDIAI